MTPEEVQRRMKRVAQLVATLDDRKRELAIQAGLLDRRFAKRDQVRPRRSASQSE